MRQLIRRLNRPQTSQALAAKKDRHPTRPVKNQRGVAILVAMFALTLLTFLAMEIAFETNVEYISSAQGVNKLKAYYAAKGAMEMSLLRILIYKKAMAAFGKNLGKQKNMLDPIWQFPFAWPPSAHLPEEMSGVDKSQIQAVEKESNLEAQYVTTIASEGSLIDINDLGSSSKTLREATKKQILQIFERELETNDDFREKYGAFEFDQLVNNMIDWVDEDRESLNAGDEQSVYSNLEFDSLFNRDFIPPNQPFKTLDELHMVATMTDDLFDLLKDRITVYGTKGINVNYASGETLKSLDANLTDEAIKAILERRDNPEQGGPFKDENDFFGFIAQWVSKDAFNPAKIPLIFDVEFNFRITSTGTFGRSAKEITAITYDFEQNMERLIEFLDKDLEKPNDGQPDQADSDQPNQQPATGQPAQGEQADQQRQATVPKGRPRVVYWNET